MASLVNLEALPLVMNYVGKMNPALSASTAGTRLGSGSSEGLCCFPNPRGGCSRCSQRARQPPGYLQSTQIGTATDPVSLVPLSHRFMALHELLRVCSVTHVEQKAFDGGVSHRGFPGCVDCML